MSATSSNPNMPDIPLIPPPPPGLTYIAVIQPSISLLIITVFFLGIFVPLLTALFLLSSRDLRRKPIFVLSVLIVILGIVQASLSIWAQVYLLLSCCTNIWLIKNKGVNYTVANREE